MSARNEPAATYVVRADGRASVCLSMIVKNEAEVIRRCLASVLPFIDAWIVCDTGSTDGTQLVVREVLGTLPGAVYERPWRDFSHNRNEALELSRAWADYSLVIDADEVLVVDPGFVLPELTADAYRSRHRGARSDSDFERIKLVKSTSRWRYVGPVHEVLSCRGAEDPVHIEGMLCVGHFDGARNRGAARDKYLADAALLERALAVEPENAHDVFYLAQSYRDAGDRPRAIASYRRRAAMGGWAEEVWYALYQIGVLSLAEGDVAEGCRALLDAFQFRPSRVEPLCALARHHRLRKEWQLAHLFAARAVAIPRPDDMLFVTDAMYRWRSADELSIAAYYVGRYEESRRWAEQLLATDALPAEERERVEENLRFAIAKLDR